MGIDSHELEIEQWRELSATEPEGLYWATLAYVLLQQLRDRGLAGTRLARAQCDTLRLRLLKIGAHIRVTARRICVALSELAPDADLFILAAQRLRSPPDLA